MGILFQQLEAPFDHRLSRHPRIEDRERGPILYAVDAIYPDVAMGMPGSELHKQRPRPSACSA